MSYGAPVRIVNFSHGLDHRLSEADHPPGGALVAQNISLDEVGALSKRRGFQRFAQEIYGVTVRALVPVESCFGVHGLMVVEDRIRIARIP